MRKEVKIKSIEALEVFDSRGNPTIQVEVVADNGISRKAMVPSGASTGSFEAIELRDNDKSRLNGKGVKNAVDNVNTKIAKALIGMNIFNQEEIDKALILLDGTENKAKIGANAILGTSLAVCKVAARTLEQEVYEYIGGINGGKIPLPMMNILNGGKHSENNINIQEFMIVPVGKKDFKRITQEGVKDFKKMMQICVEIYNELKKVLKKDGYSVQVGDEGGFAPNLKNEEEAIQFILKAIEKAGYKPGEEVTLALDIASTEMYEVAKKKGRKGYIFWKTGEFKTSEEMIKYIEELTKKYPIVSVEDGLAEEDWQSWSILNKMIGNEVQIVGDDLFVTNIKRLEKGITEKSANSILIKLNQIGTLTETIQTIQKAKQNNFTTIISHRSGETEDTFIADFAVAMNAGQIKTGAPCRTDRVAKYNRLINIENKMK